jgi:inner membrane protein
VREFERLAVVDPKAGGGKVATVFSHAVAALGIGACFYRPEIPKRVWAMGALCAAIPDVDVIGFALGVDYGDPFGHRGFTHSLFFAALLALAMVGLVFARGAPHLSRSSLWWYFFLATASHGFLDAMTNGGLGVAFFAPFDNSRYFLPWTPIQVSPIGITNFIADGGLSVFPSEFLWIWLPSALLAAIALLARRQELRGGPNEQ